MSIKETILKLTADVLVADANLQQARSALAEAEGSIQNHVYESLEDAENYLMNSFENEARDDCEGSGNCGCEEYSQDFLVGADGYTATGSFSYDRHDKQYYYVDGCSYSYKKWNEL